MDDFTKFVSLYNELTQPNDEGLIEKDTKKIFKQINQQMGLSENRFQYLRKKFLRNDGMFKQIRQRGKAKEPKPIKDPKPIKVC